MIIYNIGYIILQTRDLIILDEQAMREKSETRHLIPCSLLHRQYLCQMTKRKNSIRIRCRCIAAYTPPRHGVNIVWSTKRKEKKKERKVIKYESSKLLTE